MLSFLEFRISTGKYETLKKIILLSVFQDPFSQELIVVSS